MTLRLRREVGLLIVAGAIAGVMVLKASGAYRAPRTSPKTLAYEPPPVPAVVIATPEKPVLPGRDPYVEPSESQPLPPRELPPPKLGSLPLVLPPLPPGPEAGWFELLRVPGEVVEPFQFPEEGEAAGAPAVGNGATPNDASQPKDGKDAAKGAAQAPNPGANPAGRAGPAPAAGQDPASGNPETYLDRVETNDQGTFWGRIHNANAIELEARPGAIQDDIKFDWVNEKDGRVVVAGHVLKFDKVKRIILADNLRNQIARRRLKFGPGPESVRDRIQLLEELLVQARTQPWVYRECEKLADECARLAPGEDSLRLKAQVLRERGDLQGELQFYKSLEGMQGSAFQLVGFGRLKALLGLHQEAEADLRQAVAAAPANPRTHMALAELLLARGRAPEALPYLDVARRHAGQLGSDADKVRLAELAVAVLLACGRVADAESALVLIPEGERFAAPRAYLAGAITYCRPEQRAAATARFQAALSGQSSRAQLGLGVMQVLEKNWTNARSSLQAVADQDPMLRHRALQALAALYDRTGNLPAAASKLEEAMVANPRDAYGLYLQGRVRRLAGQHDGAIDALGKALQLRDDLQEAMAELALAHFELAERDPALAAENLSRASIFIDRCVDLDQKNAPKETRYLELQGVIHLKATNWRNARKAFDAGIAAGSEFSEAGRALVDYAQGRSDEARGKLAEMVGRLPFGSPGRAYAEQTIKLIDEHAKKEQIRDSFEREQVGNNWKPRRSGPAGPQIDKGELRIAGKVAKAADPVSVQYTLDQGGRLLGAEIRMQKGAGDHSTFCGLALDSGVVGAGGLNDFRVRFGFRDGKPALRIEEGSASSAASAQALKDLEWIPLDITVDATRPQRLKLALVPKEGNERVSMLEALWNDVPVYTPRELNKLPRTNKSPILIGLLVEAKQDADVDVRFDDFRLERRMEGQ